MTVKELRDMLKDLPEDMEVGVESSLQCGTIEVPDWDVLEGHLIRDGFRMDFRDDDKGHEVFLLQIDREEDSVRRWQS